MDVNLVFMEFVPDGNQFLWHAYCPLMIRLKGDLGFFADKPMRHSQQGFLRKFADYCDAGNNTAGGCYYNLKESWLPITLNSSVGTFAVVVCFGRW